MKSFQLFRYLKKWMPLIVIFFVVMTAGAYFVLSSGQTYVATAVIQYANPEAVDGLAPDGEKIDTSEINSASNMAKVMENLGLSRDDYNVDDLRSSITVTPIIKEEDVAVQTALHEQGEKTTEEPTVFAVTCTLGSDADEDLARSVLNELLDVYFADYSEKHINRKHISGEIRGITLDGYDYLDVVNQLSDLLDMTVDTLNQYDEGDMTFRSAATGYSFKNLRKDFQILQEVDIYRLYSLILGNRITKDSDVLVSKYQDQSARLELTNGDAQEEQQETDLVIDAYVRKMRSSGNTNANHDNAEGVDNYNNGFDNYILDDVYDDFYYKPGPKTSDGSFSAGQYLDVDQTVEYDTLLGNWAKAKNDADIALVDKDYCQFILSAYGFAEPLKPTLPPLPVSGSAVTDATQTTDAETGTDAEPETTAAAEIVPAGIEVGTTSAAAAEPAGAEIGTTSAAAAEPAGAEPGSASAAAAEPAGAEIGSTSAAETEPAETETDGAAADTAAVLPETAGIEAAFSNAVYPEVSYSVVSSPATAGEVEEQIRDLMERLAVLFEIADATNSEYNEYLGAQNIQTLSSVRASEGINLSMYMVIIALVFLLLGCGAAVILGRTGEILEYIFLCDHLTGCMNRVACDNYIASRSKEPVESAFCCVYLQLRNQREINRDIGREEADKILQAFGQALNELAGNRKNSFVGYNGSGQFWAFFDLDPNESDSVAAERERLVAILSDRISGYPAAYSLGAVNARELSAYNIRTLISKAAEQRADYVTARPESFSREPMEAAASAQTGNGVAAQPAAQPAGFNGTRA